MDLQSYCYQAHEGFEGRNQEYGAYVIRRDYSSIVTRVLIVVIIASGLIFATPMIQRLLTPVEKVEQQQQQQVELEVEVPLELIEEEEKQEEEKKTEVVIEVPPPPEVEQVKFTEIEVKEEKPEVPELKTNEEVKEKQAVIATEDKTGVATDAPPEKLDFSEKPSEDPGKGGTGEEDNKTYMEFEVVKNADYPGGIDAFRKELQSKINYPSMARRKETQGKVTLQFTVDKDGSISDIKILKDIGDGCGDAAVEALKKMPPKWSPATNAQGKPVKVRKTIPVDFRLAK
ncbi:MAG: energy transducer TonB [Raineya sp.]